MKRLGGFTLIEMTVVVAIVAILAAAAIPLQELAVRRAQEAALREALRTLRTAIDEHRRAVEARMIAPGHDGTPYPASLEVLVDGVPLIDQAGQPDPKGRRLYFLRRLPRDPFADRSLPAAETWRLRSSTSPPDLPQPGFDVYDVLSRASGVAIDGTRYADW